MTPQLKWYYANREKAIANTRAWQKANPERVKANGNRWRREKRAKLHKERLTTTTGRWVPPPEGYDPLLDGDLEQWCKRKGIEFDPNFGKILY